MSVLGSVGSTENVYTFVRGTCERTSGPNVTRQIQTDRRNRNEQALALTIGDWVLFDSKMEDEPIWLGRVMSNPAWEGMCVALNGDRRAKTYDNGVEIGSNEVGIFVQWYEKMDMNAIELNYRVSRTIDMPQVQSNYYLVRAGFEMHEMHEMNGRINPVPRLRTAARNRANWHNKEMRFKWKMDKRVRQEALSKCGVNT